MFALARPTQHRPQTTAATHARRSAASPRQRGRPGPGATVGRRRPPAPSRRRAAIACAFAGRRGPPLVELPDALDRRYPNAARKWPWQWVFPATRTYVDPVTGQMRRITFTRRCCNGPSATRRSQQGCRSERVATRSGTFRDPFAGGQVRYPHDSGAAWAPGREYDDDLPARTQPRGSGRAESTRWRARGATRSRHAARTRRWEGVGVNVGGPLLGWR